MNSPLCHLSEMKPGSPTPDHYWPQLDGLRALAVFWVMVDHFAMPGVASLKLGRLGVTFFFILTGFFLVRNLSRYAGTGWSGLAGVKLFWLKRSARILPAYYLCLVLGMVAGSKYMFDWFWSHVLFLTNFEILRLGHWPADVAHFWSLCVQEQFYLLAPLLIILVPVRSFHWCCLGLMGLGLLFRSVVLLWNPQSMLPWITLPGVLDAFGVGMLAAWMAMRSVEIRHRLLVRGDRAALSLLLMLLVAGFFYSIRTTPLVKGFSALVIAGGMGAIILLLTQAPALGVSWTHSWIASFNRLMSGRGLRFFGRISYGTYIYHLLVQLVAVKHLGLAQTPVGQYAQFFLMVGATYVVATASYFFMETPIQQAIHSRFFTAKVAASASGAAS